MPTQPNVLFIMVDQMRGDAFGAAGNDVILTPNLDALAGKGTRFNHACTPSPSCIPTLDR